MAAYALEHPIVAVDVVVFRVHQERLEVLLHRRREEPYQGIFALPGVAVRVDETLAKAAQRALSEKIGWPEGLLKCVYFEQLAAFDAIFRDPRGRTVSVAYLALIHQQPEMPPQDIQWKSAIQVASEALPFDHTEIVATAITRLQGKIRYTNIAQAFLPETFRIDELHKVYETILGHELNLANFRIKLLKLDLIELFKVLTEAPTEKGGRPPHLYRFKQDLLATVERDFL
ncbi:NUDIX hydrolase [Candidatus Vecturithrix granuli]|uniref:NUDIX hydrolase n=1 Tax=Vecturithrix granuli TaxID=1499967 RepID=A0A081BUA4_VECG1|nr:NUDIX hydrolase [Candidatus Vecturithrix granuli]